MSAVRTTCPYCGVGCGVIVSANRDVRGDPDHPANQGRLCAKGSALGETLRDTDRLLRPCVAGHETGWDDALRHVAARFRDTIAEHGPESVAFYVSGQLLTEDYYVANKLMKGFIGGANIDTNSRLCMASTAAGHVRAFGSDVVPGLYEDLEQADLVVLVGSNTAWCHPVLYQRLVAAKEARGTRIVTIDPRRTATSEIADLHLALAPGSDVMLFSGLLAYLLRESQVNISWVLTRTAGLSEALDMAVATAGSIETVAAVTGLRAEDVETFYRWFGATERTVTAFSQGVNQSSAGTDKVNAIINCHLATGRIGRPGMGPFSLTGQPNAMGGREVGGFANQVAVHVGFDNPAEVARIGKFWEAPSMVARPGLKAVDMFDAVLDGRIKAIWIMATNPADSLPRSHRVRQALKTCPFVVVSDCWDTDTTAYAHVTLPAAGWGEKNGTVTNSERCISRQRPFRAPPGDAMPDWWMLANVARHMGWGDAFAYARPAEIFREHAALSGHMNASRRAFNIGGLAEITDAEYDALAPIRWPVVSAASRTSAQRMFADGRFGTADGRARFVPTPWRQPAAVATRAFPYVLNTGRIRDQWHTMTRTGLVPRLMMHQDEPYAELHPYDAGKLGVETGGLLRIETSQGAAILKCHVTDTQRPGEVFAPMHWTDRFSSPGPINHIVSAACDPVSGQPELKATPARLAPVPTLWRGLLVNLGGALPRGAFYSARIPHERGQIITLRGWRPLPTGAAFAEWVEDLLGCSAGEIQFQRQDLARGASRFALVTDGQLQACLFLSKELEGLPADREAMSAILGQACDPETIERLLAIPEPGQRREPLSPVICSCFSVRAATIKHAIARDNLRSVAEIGVATCAGTSCGSCRPELVRMLRERETVAV